MIFDQAIYFVVFCNEILMYFSTQDEFLDIFNVFFIPSIARVEKYIENIVKFLVSKITSKCRENMRQS